MAVKILDVYKKMGLLNKDGSIKTMEERREILGIPPDAPSFEEFLKVEKAGYDLKK